MSIWRLFPKGFRPRSQLVLYKGNHCFLPLGNWYSGILTHLEVGWRCSGGADYSWVLLSDGKWCNLVHSAPLESHVCRLLPGACVESQPQMWSVFLTSKKWLKWEWHFRGLGSFASAKLYCTDTTASFFFLQLWAKLALKSEKNISKATSGKQQVQIEQWSKATALILSFLDNWMLYSKTGCKHDFQSWIPVSTPP